MHACVVVQCASPALSDTTAYPLFSRTVAPETSKGPAFAALMRQHKWSKAVLLSSTDSVWFESGLSLTRQLQAAGLTVFKPAAFQPDTFNAVVLREVKHSGIRFIVLLAYGDDTTTVARVANKEEMNGAGYAWLRSEEMVGASTDLIGWLAV